MAIPRTNIQNIRGLQDIRTHSGRVDQEATPYRTHLKLSYLELEKVRRGKEKESALQRVKNIDARFQEIEVQKARLLKVLAKQKDANPSDVPVIMPQPRLNTGGIKIKY
ncbi:MAG: hypothetical protein HZA78_11395 [Candidatus Schekmanbacteria bacterium]|nr:hypothetical protein [Candidatus Schekmanbacteria bacterium]